MSLQNTSSERTYDGLIYCENGRANAEPLRARFTYIWVIDDVAKWCITKEKKVSAPFSVEKTGEIQASIIASITDSTDDVLSLYLYPKNLNGKPIELRYQFTLANTELEEYDMTKRRQDIFLDSYPLGFRHFAALTKLKDALDCGNESKGTMKYLEVLCNIYDITPKIEFDDLRLTNESPHDRYFPKLLLPDDGFRCDIWLECKTRVFPAHYVILAARFKYFEESLRTEKRIDMSNVEPAVVEDMLHYAYTGDLEYPFHRILELYKAADDYDAEDLMVMCEYEMQKYMSCTDVIDFLVFADRENCLSVKEYCKVFIMQNANRIIELEPRLKTFVNMHRELFQEIIDEWGKAYEDAKVILTNFCEADKST